MSWKTELKQASFGGVPFKVDTADMTFGRSVKTEEAVSGGAKIRKDLDISKLSSGQLAKLQAFQGGESGTNSWVTKNDSIPRTFTIIAHFSGLNYKSDRDKFIEIVEKGESAELQLPTFGAINVFAGQAIVRFSNREGGFETVQIAFTQDQKTVHPTDTINTSKAATDAADESKTSILAEFGTELSGGATWVQDDAGDATELISSTINETLGFGAAGDGLEAITEASNLLAQNATTLIYTPTTLANKVNDAITALTFAFEQPRNAFDAQLQLLDSYGTIDNSVGATTVDQDAIDNNNSFVQIVGNLALVEAGRAAVLAEYDSLDDALAVKVRFEAAARAQQLISGNTPGQEESYRDIAVVIALVSSHINAQENLPSNIDIEYPDSNPALALANDLYGDAGRAPELVTRNAARNPLFLPRNLSVLSF